MIGKVLNIRRGTMFQCNFADFDKFFGRNGAGLSAYCAKPF